jgi:hypothetical protein
MANTFEDICIVHSGTTPCTNLLQKFKKTLSTRVLTDIIQWETSNAIYVVTNDGTRVRYTKSYWSNPLYSQQVLPTKNITYFQVRITNHGTVTAAGGIVVGISNKSERGRKMICMINTATGASEYSCFTATTGDVVGVVIDHVQDSVRFYLNGRFQKEGFDVPSAISPMYAVIELYFLNCVVESGDYYKYHELVHV